MFQKHTGNHLQVYSATMQKTTIVISAAIRTSNVRLKHKVYRHNINTLENLQIKTHSVILEITEDELDTCHSLLHQYEMCLEV
jgi:EAL domain-containing protein (putative c-di-GMP-specific phosphodiesterase class I)